MTENDKITCQINGQEYTLPKGTTLLDFLAEKKAPVPAVVVEYNKEVLLKGEYEGIVLQDGDTLEVVQIIGGG